MLDQRLIKSVKSIIELGSCAVSKPVRAGFTTSCVHACNQLNKKVLILSPTRRILTETVSRASSQEIDIPGNIECENLKESVRSYPILAKLPLSLPDCNNCFLYSTCKVTEILREEFKSEVKMTYAKLETLMLSVGKTADKIISKISGADVILLDEAHGSSLFHVGKLNLRFPVLK